MNNDRFYEHVESGMIKCGECWNQDVLDTKTGKFTGDEQVFEKDIRLLEDDDTEPYQCEGCNKQNDAYDNVLDDMDVFDNDN